MNESATQKTYKCHEEVSTQIQKLEIIMYNLCFTINTNVGGKDFVIAVKFEN